MFTNLIKMFIILLINSLLCFEYSSGASDQCVDICHYLKLPKLELDKYEQIVCQRGCRFFNIVKFKDSLNIEASKRECRLSCLDSYTNKIESKICVTGCTEMAKKRQKEVDTFITITRELDGILISEPDFEMPEMELSDPIIRGQLNVGFNVAYKIPETNIRTMPIQFDRSEERQKVSTDWLDCASRNSGIPKWILFCSLLITLIIVSSLCFSSDKKPTEEDDDDCILVDVVDKRPILKHEILQIEEMNLCDDCLQETKPV